MAWSNWVVTLEAIPKVGPFFSFFVSSKKSGSELIHDSTQEMVCAGQIDDQKFRNGALLGYTIRGEFVSNVLLLSLSIHKDLKLVCTYLY